MRSSARSSTSRVMRPVSSPVRTTESAAASRSERRIRGDEHARRRGRAQSCDAVTIDVARSLRHHDPVELLEREALLDTLVGYADEARRGDSRVILLAGEAGVGKTSVVEALRDRL